MTKKRILVDSSFTYGAIDGSDFDGMYAEQVAALLQEKIEAYGERILKFSWYRPPYEDAYRLALMLEREETDAEYEQRLAKEKEQQERNRRWELEQLERLRKKYEQEN